MPAQPPARAGQVDIVIAGGGPVGLMLACELRLSGTDPIVLERLPGIDETPKGNGLAGQIVPMLDYRGLLDRLRQEATFAGPVPRFSFGPLELDFSRLGTSPVHILTVPQRRLEKVLVRHEALLLPDGGERPSISLPS
jgi:2-polyprenyl-6-methoxyphenol hydroxylase-like FAD-dependent oxidoreductase